MAHRKICSFDEPFISDTCGNSVHVYLLCTIIIDMTSFTFVNNIILNLHIRYFKFFFYECPVQIQDKKGGNLI